jgi:hypothetical protein
MPYVATIDGRTYGTFGNWAAAQTWAIKEFPVAHAQNRIRVTEFENVVGPTPESYNQYIANPNSDPRD